MSDKLRRITFDYPKLETVFQGVDAVTCLAEQVASGDKERVFVIASRTLSRNSDVIQRLRQALGNRLADVFTDMPAHTPRPAVMAAIERAAGVKTDLLVSIGGGSVIDAAKTVQLALDQDIRTEAELLAYAQFADGSRGPRCGDFRLFDGPSRLRQIAVPTTLSGAEFSNNAGVTDPARSLKEGYRGPDLCPQVIIYDPLLCRLTPDWLWLSTAIRSLDHAVEGYCSPDVHSFLEGHFLHAMELFASSLPGTCDDPADLQLRSLSQQAVWLACCGLGKVRHGASHGIGYLLGAVCGVPHGITSCIMLPAVLRWNSEVNGARQHRINAALGAMSASAPDTVRALVGRLGLPQTLRDAGVARDELPRIADLASQHPVVKSNPRAIESAGDVLEILELAWGAQDSVAAG